jgi:hypothetical protein
VIDCQRFYGAAGIGAALAAGMRLSRSFALPAAPFARKSTPLGCRPTAQVLLSELVEILIFQSDF